MAEVVVKTTFNSGWNVGDHVELVGKELQQELDNDNVVLVNQPEEVAEVEPVKEEVKNEDAPKAAVNPKFVPEVKKSK